MTRWPPDTAHKVNGGASRTAAVILVVLANSPEAGTTYKLGEEIEVEVWFDRAVTVTGATLSGDHHRHQQSAGGLRWRHRQSADVQVRPAGE